MKSPRKIVALGTGSVAMFAASISALPANAVTVAGCGDEPTGATLTKIGNICEVDFKTAGSYSYAVPTGASGLAALIVGAGSGARVNGDNEGYAGAGGKVRYLDLTAVQNSDVITTVVGEGSTSTSGNPANGGSSSVTYNSQAYAASGGVHPGIDFYCSALGGYSTYVGAAPGAGGDPVYGTSNGPCNPVTETGLNPSAAQQDNYGNALPAIFTTYNAFLGRGGRVIEHPTTLNSDASLIATGAGADVYVATINTVPQWNSNGGSGRVIFRFNAFAVATPTPTPTPSATLAKTGSEFTKDGLIAMVLALTGLGLVARANRAPKVPR